MDLMLLLLLLEVWVPTDASCRHRQCLLLMMKLHLKFTGGGSVGKPREDTKIKKEWHPFATCVFNRFQRTNFFALCLFLP